MSTVTVGSYLDGFVVDTSKLNGDFDALSEINGKLDPNNVPATFGKALDYTHLQLGAVTGGQMVGGTANLDYFNGVRYVYVRDADAGNLSRLRSTMAERDSNYLSYVSTDRSLGTALNEPTRDDLKVSRSSISSTFGGVTDAVTASAKLPLAIPGASLTFALPYKAYVLVTWQVTWTSDAARFGPTPGWYTEEQLFVPDPSSFPEPNTAIRFYVDGSEYKQECTTRETREAMFAHPRRANGTGSDGAFAGYAEGDAGKGLDKHQLRDRHKARYWSGHAFIGQKLRGFHSVSLRVISQEVVRQTRVRCRNIKVLYFKAPES